MNIPSEQSQQMQPMSSNESLTIPDLTVEPLENMGSEQRPAKFGKIVNSNYTSPDPKLDTDEHVITEQPTRADAGLSGNLTKSVKPKRKNKSRRYHYVKQGKKCKKVMNKYKKLRCRGKRSKKCRPLQRKRKTCKKIIKHKKAMTKRSRKMH